MLITGKSWVVEVYLVEELFFFQYPFQLPALFLQLTHTNELRLKIRLIKSLAVSQSNKRLDLQEFFTMVHLPNYRWIQIKKYLIQLFKELVEAQIIWNKIQIVLNSGNRKEKWIHELTGSDITRRTHYIKFEETIRKL